MPKLSTKPETGRYRVALDALGISVDVGPGDQVDIEVDGPTITAVKRLWQPSARQGYLASRKVS